MADSSAAPKVTKNGEWSSSMLDIADDPATCLIGYCLPCVLYGQVAEKVHGGDLVNHCLKFWLYSFVCLCGLVSGPTRKSIRETYELPISPEFLKDQGESADCITGTIPCVGCFALCQDAREINTRNPSGPIKAMPFEWGPVSASASAPATTTTAPVQAEISK